MKHLQSLRELLTEVEYKADIMCLAELKCDVADSIIADNYFEKYAMTPSTTDMYMNDRYERIVKSTKTMHNGTAMMLKPELYKFSKTANIETPRIVLQRIKSEKVNLLIRSVYMPNNGDNTAQQKYRDMANLITSEVSKLREASKVILIL